MIRLVTVIGHGTELLPHFIKHYQKYVNEIQIVCYNSELHPNITSKVGDVIANYKNVSIVKDIYHRIFDWETVTNLYNEVKLTHDSGWWVVADIDEFHLYPNDNLQRIIWDCEENGWDIVRGGFIDRIGEGGTFPLINDSENIWKQFPNMGFFRYPMSGACPNKVCVMRGRIELTYGQHYAKIDGHTTWRWQGWGHPLIAPIDTHSVQVHHFKWDITSIQRIKKVAELNREYSYSSEYMRMYKELEKSNFLIDISNKNYMFQPSDDYGEYRRYRLWNKLIKKIVSI
jgi:hypothetical protein